MGWRVAMEDEPHRHRVPLGLVMLGQGMDYASAAAGSAGGAAGERARAKIGEWLAAKVAG